MTEHRIIWSRHTSLASSNTHTVLCSSFVFSESGILSSPVFYVISSATEHLHMLFLQPLRWPAPCPHFHLLNICSLILSSSFASSGKPSLISPIPIISSLNTISFFLTILQFYIIKWLFDNNLTLSHQIVSSVWAGIGLFVLTTAFQVIRIMLGL